MRSIAEQEQDELGGRWSVLVRQKRDHQELDRLLETLVATEPAQQPEVLQRIYRLVFPHAFAEESVLWPAMRRALADGEQLTLMVEQEHQQINELVTELESMAPEGRRRSTTSSCGCSAFSGRRCAVRRPRGRTPSWRAGHRATCWRPCR